MSGGQTERQNDGPALASKTLAQQIKSYLGVTVQVLVHRPGALPRSAGKAKRVIGRE